MKQKYKLLRKSLKLVWVSAPGLTAANTLLSVIKSILPLLLLLLLKKVVDEISIAATESKSLADIVIPLSILAVIWFIDEALNDVSGFLRKKQALKFEEYMYGLLHAKSSSIDLINFEDPKYYDCLARAVRDATWRPNNILNNFVSLSGSSLSLILITGLILSIDWFPALILLVANIPGIWLRLHYASVLYDFKRENTAESRKTAYYNWLLTGDRPSREIRLFGLGKYFRSLFNSSFLKLKGEELKILKNRIYISLVSDFVKAAALLAIFIFIAGKTISGTISIGTMAMLLLAFRQGMLYLKQLFESLGDLYEDSLFLNDIFEFLELEPVISGPENIAPATFKNDLIADRLTFSYPGSGKKVIDNVSFRLKKGEVLGIAGENGAGKSTLIRLLARLYEPESGTVIFDGIDMKEFDPTEYRKQFSVIFQDFMLYNLPAGENIRLGWIDDNDKSRLEESATKAGIHDFIEKLRSGYDTELGNLFGQNRELSWGEWQKVALARALYRKAPLLILDEPASALDASTEFMIFKSFREIVKNRTAILISHKVSQLSLADRIIFLEKGRIAEVGSHSELLAMKGLYYSMYTKQTSRLNNDRN